MRLIEVAVVDERCRSRAAGDRTILGDKAVPGGHLGLQPHLVTGKVGQRVERRDLRADRRQHGMIGSPGEHVDAVIREVGKWVDGTRRRQLGRRCEQGCRVGLTKVGGHAALQRNLRPPLGTAIGSTGNDPGARHLGREGDVELSRHIRRPDESPETVVWVRSTLSDSSGSPAVACCAAETSETVASACSIRDPWRASFGVRRNIAHQRPIACAKRHWPSGGQGRSSANACANPSRPSAVTATARLSRSVAIQPSSSQRRHMEAPSRPPRCGAGARSSRGRSGTAAACRSLDRG